jgi:hypothetical protein
LIIVHSKLFIKCWNAALYSHAAPALAPSFLQINAKIVEQLLQQKQRIGKKNLTETELPLSKEINYL